jgi:hypothetical protein
METIGMLDGTDEALAAALAELVSLGLVSVGDADGEPTYTLAIE